MSKLLRKLSGSTDGKGVKVAATASAGTTIHTAVAGTTAGTFDIIWLWAYNSHTDSVELTLEYGGTTDPDNHIVKTIPPDSGAILIVSGLILQNTLVLKAYASVASVIVLYGYVYANTD